VLAGETVLKIKFKSFIMGEKITFSFGKNWQNFLKSLDEDRFKNAELSLTEFLGLKDLKKQSFLDIGCGSGLFSRAAFNLGANKIVSFDVDPFSVKCCKYLHNKANGPKNWKIHEGSILNNNFTSKLGKFDIVYAWGVLHHTNKMWDAIKNSAKLVNKNGYYYIAIYNRVEGIRGSNFWSRVKRLYNTSPAIGKYAFEMIYILACFVVNLMKLRNPIKKIKNYKSGRGMDWRTDITDWLGGYPYEFATVEEIFNFMKTYFSNFNLVNIKTTNGLGNNWYLFKKND
jgi:2-polyprenyl-3-methyl-5-hydroxy-6-metoxy-1,4-benzoquinol methylase